MVYNEDEEGDSWVNSGRYPTPGFGFCSFLVSLIWRFRGWNLDESLKLKFGQYFEAEVWSSVWSWHVCEIFNSGQLRNIQKKSDLERLQKTYQKYKVSYSKKTHKFREKSRNTNWKLSRRESYLEKNISIQSNKHKRYKLRNMKNTNCNVNRNKER